MESKRVQYEIEYVLSASPHILYNHIGTPGGLSKWFADNVKLQNNNIYCFEWEGSTEKAKLIAKEKNKRIKFQWELDEGSDRHFSFTINKDTMTGDSILLINDTCEEDELSDCKELWNYQIDELKHLLGC